MIRIKLNPKTKIGYRIADIGPGGKEYNIKEVNWPKSKT